VASPLRSVFARHPDRFKRFVADARGVAGVDYLIEPLEYY